MTSKLTLEQAIQHAKERAAALSDPCAAQHSQLAVWLRELQERRKAERDSEPFAYIIQDKYERERDVEGHLSRSHVSKYVSQEDINEHEITCTPLYRHAQPAPVVEEWTDEQCLEFLCIAFRHAEIKGDLATDDIRLGIKMVNANRVVERKAAQEGVIANRPG